MSNYINAVCARELTEMAQNYDGLMCDVFGQIRYAATVGSADLNYCLGDYWMHLDKCVAELKRRGYRITVVDADRNEIRIEW